MWPIVGVDVESMKEVVVVVVVVVTSGNLVVEMAGMTPVEVAIRRLLVVGGMLGFGPRRDMSTRRISRFVPRRGRWMVVGEMEMGIARMVSGRVW